MAGVREAVVHGDFGGAEVRLRRVRASERLSRPFVVELEVDAPEQPLDLLPLLTGKVGAEISDGSGVVRRFHGRLVEAEQVVNDEAGQRYRLELRPWLSLLDRNLNSRIFQSLSALDIVRQVFDDAGFSDYEVEVSASPRQRDYCVQYRESDCNFVSRLLEEEALRYFYRHEADRHVLVISDGSPHSGPTLPFRLDTAAKGMKEAHVGAWSLRAAPGAQKVTLRDYDFENPTKDVTGDKDESGEHPRDDVEIYDHPPATGEVTEAAIARTYAEGMLKAERAERRVYLGISDEAALACGETLTLEDHPDPACNRAYHLVGLVHDSSVQTYRSGAGSGLEMTVAIEAIPDDVPWTPPRATPRPRVSGPQTATVVGEAGEVIYVDNHGRVKVQFHWDRQGKMDEKSSFWIRVSQGWADGGFGSVFLPRIGEEVIVDFLDGDPDCPIVTGRVYNGDKKLPYDLPAKKTVSVIKTQTVGDEGSYPETEDPPSGKGYNELRFEDEGGKQEIFMRAQRNYERHVHFDEKRKTGRDVGVRVGRSRRTEVRKHEALFVETGDETREVQQGSRQTKINKSDALTVETGNYSVDVSMGKAKIEAAQEILLKVGNNTVKISPTGVEVHGLTVKITADTTLEASGLKSDFKASTLLTINGLPVMIN